MVNLNQAQKIEIIRLMFDSLGYDFRLSNGDVPSFKAPTDEEFTVLKYDFEPLKVAKEFNFDVLSINKEDDLFNGVALLLDAQQFEKTITSDFFYGDNVHKTPDTIVENIVSSLEKDGALFPMSDFKEVLKEQLKVTRSPRTLFKLLNNSNQKVMWPKHYTNLNTPPPSELLVDHNNVPPIVKAEGLLSATFSKAASEHYLCPALFVHKVHGLLGKKGITISFDGYPGTLEDMTPSLRVYLMKTLELYRNEGKKIFDDVSKDLTLEYRPLSVNTRRIGRRGVEILHEIIKNNKKNISHDERVNKQVENKNPAIRNLMLRHYIWSFRGAINVACGRSGKDRADKMNQKWEELTENISPISSENDLKEVLDRIKNIYGPILLKTAKDIKSEVRERVEVMFGSKELKKISLPILELIKPKGKEFEDPLDAMRDAVAKDACVDVFFLSDCKKEFLEKGALLTLNTANSEMNKVSSVAFKYQDLPSNDEQPNYLSLKR